MMSEEGICSICLAGIPAGAVNKMRLQFDPPTADVCVLPLLNPHYLRAAIPTEPRQNVPPQQAFAEAAVKT